MVKVLLMASSSEADTGLLLTINELGYRTENSKLIRNVTFRSRVNMLEGRTDPQRDFDKL